MTIPETRYNIIIEFTEGKKSTIQMAEHDIN